MLRDTGNLEQYYFVCETCGGKGFSDRQAVRCPRCGQRLFAVDRMLPPWKKNAVRRAQDLEGPSR